MTLREKLEAGLPVVTLELSPPKGTDVSRVLKQARGLIGRVDAINVPDCQLSMLKMSSMVTSKLIQDETGIEAVWQLTCRDRNAIALQADILGAYALGLRNVLALTGDPVQLGDQKDVAKQVFHLDSVRLLDLIHHLNNSKDFNGAEMKSGGTDMTVGAALHPAKVFSHAQQQRIQYKIERGVRFFQTQPVYDVESVERMMEMLDQVSSRMGVPLPRVLVGIIPPRSADAARHMNRAVVGVNIPQSLIDLLDQAEDPAGESIRFCTDLVESIKPLCDSFHFMPVGMVNRMPPLLETCFPAVSPSTV